MFLQKKDNIITCQFIVAALLFLLVSCQGSPTADGGDDVTATVIPTLEIEDVVTHESLSSRVGTDSVLESMRGQRGVGLVREADRDLPRLERPQNREFHLEPGDPFTPYLILVNNTDVPQTQLVSAVVDYEQISFTFDGEVGLLHEVTIPASTELEIPVSVDINGEGMHDLLFLMISYPYNATLDVDERMGTFNDTFGTRAVIYVGQDETPVRGLDYITRGTNIPDNSNYNPPVHFVEITEQDETHPSERQLYVAHAEPGETYHFQIRMANEGDQPVAYTFVPLLNYHQTMLQGAQMLPVQLGANKELLMDVELSVPDEAGIYLFELVYVYDSYRSLLQEEVSSPIIKSSERLAIVVK